MCPMWTTFWPDVLVALIGAVLTVGIAFATYILSVRRDELRALNSLIVELHHRRAFSGTAVIVSGAQDTQDFQRANASVISVRDEIRRTRDRVRPIPGLQEPLMRMTRFCNYYLEETEWDPDSYAVGLVRLRDELHEQIRALAAARRGTKVLVPGAKAF